MTLQLPECEARRFFQQLVSGIECCHLNNIVHRDLKPENLLLDAHNNVKICDFGLANTLRDGYLLGTSCGSPNYAAPEVIAGRLYAGPEVDIWSCGVILYALAYGSLPFDEESIPLLFQRIKSGKYSLRATISHGARSMIARLLVVNPMKRAKMKEIRSVDQSCDSLDYLSSRSLVWQQHQQQKIGSLLWGTRLSAQLKDVLCGVVNNKCFLFLLAGSMRGFRQLSRGTSVSHGNQMQGLPSCIA